MSNVVARTVFTLGSALLPLVALAGASGTCTYGGEKLTIVDGVVYKGPDDPSPEKKEVVVALASIKLDTSKIKAAEDPEDAVREQVWGAELAGQVRITIGNGAVRQLYAHVPPGHNSSRSGGSELGDVKFSRSDAKGTAGHYTLKGKANDDLSCDVNFDLDF